MNANLLRSTIEMTKNEAAAAGKLNSDEFNELKALREMYPNFKIVITKSKPVAKSLRLTDAKRFTSKMKLSISGQLFEKWWRWTTDGQYCFTSRANC